jgi:HlyD family secretion protein
MKRRILYAGVAVVAVAAVVGVFVIPRWLERREEEQDVRSTVVERGTMLVAISASGGIEPGSRVGLVFEVPGRVAEVAVGIGDEVGSDDVLVRLDDSDLAYAVRQAEISLEAARVRLERLQEPADEADIAQAQDAVDQAASALRLAQIADESAQASVVVNEALEDAQSAYDQELEDYTFWLGRYEDGKADYWYVDQALEDLEDARLALERARQRADQQIQSTGNELARAADAYRQAQDNLDRLLRGAEDLDLRAAQLDVDAATLNLEKAQSDLAKATLRAPFDGTVAEVNVTAGEMAPAGMPAVTLLDSSAYHIDVSVDEMDVGGLAVGQEVIVTVDALADVEIAGVVERIAPAAQLEGGVVYYGVCIALEPTDAPVRADMTANATIIVKEINDVLIVPTWIVRVDRDTGDTFVHRQTDGAFERADVTLGVRYGGLAHAQEGLDEGDVLVWIEENNGFGFGHP